MQERRKEEIMAWISSDDREERKKGILVTH
jgi:hypothetical protein